MANAMPVTRIRCWGCGEQVPLKFGGGTCPSCGVSLATPAFDGHARGVAQARADEERRLQELACERQQVAARNARWGVLRRLPFVPSRRRLVALDAHIAAAHEAIAARADELGELARARYYASGWFRATGMALYPDVADEQALAVNPFRAVRYDSAGAFLVDVRLKTMEQRGVYGEYLVFDMLDAAIARGELGEAQLLRGLYVPDRTAAARDPYGTSFTEEIDILLATQRRLYIIEVKSLRRRIEVRTSRFGDRLEVHAIPYRRGGKLAREDEHIDKGPSQNHRHVWALVHELAGEVPRSALVNLTVYVDNRGFAMEAEQGVGGDYVATTSAGPQQVLRVVADIEASCSPRWYVDELDELVRLLDMRYADVDGSKAEAHRRSMEIRSRRPYTGAHASDRLEKERQRGRRDTGGPARSRDAELERMLREYR